MVHRQWGLIACTAGHPEYPSMQHPSPWTKTRRLHSAVFILGVSKGLAWQHSLGFVHEVFLRVCLALMGFIS